MWTQTISLGAHAARGARVARVVDIGVEPAIEADGERHTFFDHRRVSVRWLCGTVLTGCLGAALIGGTIYAALDHEANFAVAPTPALTPQRDVAETGINPRKGDRLLKPVDVVAAKQTFKVPQPTKIGDKEVMRTHTFVRVDTTLLTASAGFNDEVPPFNPLKVLADARTQVEAPAEPQQDDAEFSWATRDFAPPTLTTKISLSMEEVEAQVGEHVKSTAIAGDRPFALPSQLLLMRTVRASPMGALAYANPQDGLRSPFSSIEVRMVPENVTIVPRVPTPPGGVQADEKLIVIHPGELVESQLLAAGVARAAIAPLIAAFRMPPGQPAIPDGRRVKLLFADTDQPGDAKVLARLSIYDGETPETTIALGDDGTYVKLVGDNSEQPQTQTGADDDESNGIRLYNSLYETALKQEMPKPVIDDLVRIFANDVDFQRSVSPGDSFEAFYDKADGDDGDELLFAAITSRGETYKYYRFQTPDDSLVDYYDQNGKSSRKFLVRAPILNFKITSGFGVRFHPILGYTRPHTGVDFAAPIGTPIFAAGNGTITQAGWSSGYGRRIEIQHANGYVTTYNHMSGFARGATEGARVHQGQVIGYLGQTGLATGPHLHYEVLVNGHFVDPMKVKLARTREFDGRMLGLFRKERDRVDELLNMAPSAQAETAQTAQR